MWPLKFPDGLETLSRKGRFPFLGIRFTRCHLSLYIVKHIFESRLTSSVVWLPESGLFVLSTLCYHWKYRDCLENSRCQNTHNARRESATLSQPNLFNSLQPCKFWLSSVKPFFNILMVFIAYSLHDPFRRHPVCLSYSVYLSSWRLSLSVKYKLY